jgi:mannan endo-1,6-alpha-mannosidase
LEKLDHHQFSYGVAVYLYGAAVMQNYTNASSIWVDRTSGFLDATATFLSPFPNATNIIFEAECEKDLTCNVDQYSFKAYLVRWLADTSITAPFTAGRIAPILQTSAIGAAAACTAGPYGNTCGAKWYINGSDGTSGLGQQLGAMEVMYSLLANEAEGPRTPSNVQIRDEPEIATTSTFPIMQSTTSSRPLFDSTSESFYQQKSGAFLTLASLVAYVLVI